MCDKFSGIFLKCALENFGISSGVFMSPREYFESRQFSRKLWKIMLEEISKLFDIFSSIIFHNFLPLHCEEIFLVHVALGLTCRKKWIFISSALQKFCSENYRNFCWNFYENQPRNSMRISDNFRCGISADWKIWEILGGDKA